MDKDDISILRMPFNIIITLFHNLYINTSKQSSIFSKKIHTFMWKKTYSLIFNSQAMAFVNGFWQFER